MILEILSNPFVLFLLCFAWLAVMRTSRVKKQWANSPGAYNLMCVVVFMLAIAAGLYSIGQVAGRWVTP